MRRHGRLLVTATCYAVAEHLRNRFAMVLVAGFIPTWTALAYLAVPNAPAELRLRATGQLLRPAGNQLSEITGALNAVSLIVGFMMFAAAFSGGHFDRRLVMAGYPRIHLVVAKMSALVLASGAVAVYAVAVTHFLWTPWQPVLLAAALFCAALTYGAIGVALGSLLRREVEGMFAIVMISVIDVYLQNPIASSGSDSPIVRLLPSYGAVQASTAAGFSDTALPGYLAVQLLWFTGAALIGLLAFQRRTRNTLSLSPRHPRRRLPEQTVRSCVEETEV
ncbi:MULTISPECIES: ABC transporter permease [unclassified Streptomyces]|uniref:ABC transporter permease n=1 Tax=unclassified Streptomyces TaxID=2593676 RepID=UPI00224DFB02|nr:MULTISPECIES: ABC transporter permease [unclassified Streptomyces]MCX5063797.1 ABC transporter permease [Streptomyces sp. NBC_00452]MCX5294145.1 ABC transporter permease [Streptomyces sp. NBC_00183]